jgi:hypothetical protein
MARVLRRTAKVVRRTLAVPGVIIVVAGAALLGSPAIAQAAVGSPASMRLGPSTRPGRGRPGPRG